MINSKKDISFFIKNVLLAVSLLYLPYFIWYSHVWNGCFFFYNCVASGSVVKLVYLIGYPLLAVLPFSILTYRMDDRIFMTWVSFISIAAPITSGVLFWLSHHQIIGGGFGAIYERSGIYDLGVNLPWVLSIVSSIVVFVQWRLIIKNSQAKKILAKR